MTTTTEPVTEPVQTVVTTTPTTVQTTTSAATQGGIPVEPDNTTASDDQPDETEPEDSPAADVTGEVLYVRANGGVVSGSALEIVGKITQHEVGHTFAPEAIKAQASRGVYLRQVLQRVRYLPQRGTCQQRI